MLLGFVFVLLSSFLVHAANLPPVQVTISNGPIVGEVIQTNPGSQTVSLSRFLGIPYAQPPVGKLRFRKPRPVTDKWTTPLQATNWPAGCVQFMQHPFSVKMLPRVQNQNISEDCLFLNVWSTKVDPNNEEELVPVLVWIHGGALIMGGSALDAYDGETLAAAANAVVVSINYRLSTLGFMVSQEVPDISGNQGLFDQALALEWVQENIRYFGGDPSRVTIMGESAGSWSVSLHILSPVSRNLFQNAIMMSGAAINDKVAADPAKYEAQLLTGIRKVKCATEEDTTINHKVVDCLEQLDPAVVDQIYYVIDKDPFDMQPIVVIDGDFLPAKPQELLSSGNYKTNVNLLASTVEDEGSFVFAFFPQFQAQNPESFPLAQAKQFIVDYVSQHYLFEQAPAELITKLYFSGLNDKLNPENNFRAQVGIAFGDLLLGCPTIEFAKQVFRFASQSATVYQWQYRAKLGRPESKLIDIPWASGACHGDDIFPALGLPYRQRSEFTDRERDISTEVMNFIGSFLWTGKPGNSEWLSYFKTNDKEQNVVAPYYELTNDYSRASNYKFNLKELECSLIWNPYNK